MPAASPGLLKSAATSLLRITAAVLAILLVALAAAWFLMIRMPGTSHTGPLPTATADEARLAESLRQDIATLATEIGPRNARHRQGLDRTTAWLEDRLRALGYTPRRETFTWQGETFHNVVAEKRGTTRPADIVIVGAHYDTFASVPGANDNGSGVAATLALAERLTAATLGPTLRLVLFTNEEPPFFRTHGMGSHVHAQRCRARGDRVLAMLSLETLGWYSDEPGSQKYPPLLRHLYPEQGNFVTFVGNVASRSLVRDLVGRFRRLAAFPAEGAALPAAIPGVGWSDHEPFWAVGVPAMMVTDTAPFRYPHYHFSQDTADQVQVDKLARVVAGLARTLEEWLAP